jgi:Kef-type K+ transport system membrane component KefB/mannitol/fructose-specific phosphotransferase system IIA component (Ntr-type)
MNLMEFLKLPISDPVAVFAVVIVVLLGVPLLMDKLRLPAMIGLILAGVLIGPGALGIVRRDGLVELLGSVGMVYVVFLSGLEIDAGILRKNRGRGLGFGVLTFSLPFAAGFSIGFFLLGMKPLAAALLGAVFSANNLSSLPLVGRLRLGRTRAVSGAVTATVIADIAAMLGFALMTSAPGSGLLHWFRIGLSLALLAYVGLFLVPKISGFFFRKLQPDGITEFIYAAAVLFLLAFAAQLSGLNPIVGAFLAGLALNPMIPEKSVLMGRITFVGNSVFLPFFFISAGMLVAPRAFMAQENVIAAVALIAFGTPAAKGLAVIGMRFFGRHSLTEALLQFGLTVNHGAASLAVAVAGYSLGLFGAPEFDGIIAMVMLSGAIGPLLTGYGARKLVMEARAESSDEGELSERVMVIVSNPERTRRLMDLAFMLRSKDATDPVYPVNIVQDSPELQKDVAASEKILAQTVVQGVARGVNVIPVTRVSFNVAEGVVQAARETRVSTIVAGAGPSSQFQKRPYGRIVDQIVRGSSQMVLINRLPRPLNQYASVIAVIPPLSDRQRGFRQAVSAVKSLAADLSAKITLVTLAHSGAPLLAEFDRIKPRTGYHSLLLDAWEELAPMTKKLAGPSSFYALFNVRQGGLAWQPAVERVPTALLEDNPDTAILCVYLPEDQESIDDEPSLSEERSLFGKAIAEGRVLLWKDQRPMADAIRALLFPLFGERRAVLSRLSAVLMDIAQKEPVELRPGIILLHVHAPDVEEPSIFFGVSSPGIPLLNVQEAVKILVLLIAPEHQPPEEHLKMLAKLAALVMDEGFAQRLKAAKGPEDLARAENPIPGLDP